MSGGLFDWLSGFDCTVPSSVEQTTPPASPREERREEREEEQPEQPEYKIYEERTNSRPTPTAYPSFNLQVEVDSPEQRTEGYISTVSVIKYRVRCWTTRPGYSEATYCVWRGFKDFVWLRQCLRKEGV
eukprot:CAMPEP_0118942396 /NCGR_PEP_ID=MMETSP1169-20130426/36087_1 /TAXON_ID=36882 /ORGANISM="Pyramimonas obovata, Strain CCMP722" /LENGTH=128 /DNA_ID=CAMNT_0006887407 /DNA_START=145 /DNA_END=527 /DNA_ORIENTATION=-